MSISGKTKLLGVIGSPIEHSLSPAIHNRFACDAGLDYAYLAFYVSPDTQSEFISAARALPIHGFNVTMPLKETILPLLDELDSTARAYNAANTVVNRDGVLVGYNTDGGGFMMALEHGGFAPPRIDALVLGAGGAARAVARALSGSGASVHIACRRPNEAARLDDVAYHAWSDIHALCETSNLLVNATPLGMDGVSGRFEDLNFVDALPLGAMVFDLIYAPRETPLLAAAKTRGLTAQNGLTHLVCQAALSFEIFTGVLPRREVVEELMEM